jgi:NAD(P)-dependent dehydrogenase (short-subunit alcohol dehydrogenase family)
VRDKRIIVTGGFGTLGRAVVEHLAARGAMPIAIDAAPVPGGWAGEAVGGIDLGDPGAATTAIDAIPGPIDGLINVAGGFAWEMVAGGSVETWDRLYAMNLRTALSATRAALPRLKAARGAIVNVGAAGATRAALGMGAYAASKAGVARLTEALAEELKDVGVRVNAVLPSIIDTAANRADMPDADHDRWVRPDALARVIVFLVSAEAEAVTGALVPVTGRV